MKQKGLWDDENAKKEIDRDLGDTTKPEKGGGRKVRPTDEFGVIPEGAPLALRMTPMDFEEFLGQEELMGPGKPLRRMIEEDRISSMLFWGPPGTGKTALARLIASKTHSYFKELSAVTSGVKDVREVVEFAREARKMGRKTILFLDEIHRFTKAQQDALLPHVENGTLILIGATTENPYFSVNSPLLSRMRIFKFEPLLPSHIETLLMRAITDRKRGLFAGNSVAESKLQAEAEITPQGIQTDYLIIENGVIDHIVRYCKGDARVALNVLEAVYNISDVADGKKILTLEKTMDVTQSPTLIYDKTGDQHYDIISAYIKSMRGSDPDAAVYWLARMLEAGEDPRYVARRLVICAAEDVGLADPMALVIAESAFRASEHLGMPEVRIPLAEATVYVCLAPKSNSAYLAIERALADVREKPTYAVPLPLRGTGYYGAEELGHGDGYLYPHDYPGHYVQQQYLPDELVGVKYFEPAETDVFEKKLKEVPCMDKKMGVIGAGTMGCGIAETALVAGYEVVLIDATEDLARKGYERIEKSLSKGVDKGRITPEAKENMVSRLNCSADFKELSGADVVIEAITEKIDAKKEAFKKVSQVVSKDALIGSNTSSLSITEMSKAVEEPGRFLGIHFFNPVPVMKLVEIVKGENTSVDTIERARALCDELGKTPVIVKESPGFVVNRLLCPMLNEATYLLMEGVASAEDIDTAMKLGANHPIGPLALADLIGIDVLYAIMETLAAELDEHKYKPCPLLKEMIDQGHLGRKTGQGFYEY
jgi:putative ATPase